MPSKTGYSLYWSPPLLGYFTQGAFRTPVHIIGETRINYRIRALQRMRIGAKRWIDSGEIALIPKATIHIQGDPRVHPPHPRRQPHLPH